MIVLYCLVLYPSFERVLYMHAKKSKINLLLVYLWVEWAVNKFNVLTIFKIIFQKIINMHSKYINPWVPWTFFSLLLFLLYFNNVNESCRATYIHPDALIGIFYGSLIFSLGFIFFFKYSCECLSLQFMYNKKMLTMNIHTRRK